MSGGLDNVADPRTMVRLAAGPTLHVDHPQFSGLRQVLKGVFGRVTVSVIFRGSGAY